MDTETLAAITLEHQFSGGRQWLIRLTPCWHCWLQGVVGRDTAGASQQWHPTTKQAQAERFAADDLAGYGPCYNAGTIRSAQARTDMHRITAFCFCLVSLVAVSSERPVGAEEPESFTTPADPDGIELCKLAVEYERLNKLRLEAVDASAEALNGGGKPTDETLSDEEWLKASREIEAKSIDPDLEMLPRLSEFAKSHPDSPYAFDALFLVIYRGGPQTGDVHGILWQLKEDALDVVWKDHKNDPRLFIILRQLGGALPSHKTEAFLVKVLDEGPNNTAKAAAALTWPATTQQLPALIIGPSGSGRKSIC